ncbi:hypothetical protein Tco_0921319 [Tanacetum coccineum]
MGAGPLQDPTAATISSITITTGDGMPRMRTFRETVSLESSSTNGRSLRKSLCDGRRNMVLSRALRSMGRVSGIRLRRRRAKQSGETNIEFKTVDEYSGDDDDDVINGGDDGDVWGWCMAVVVSRLWWQSW